MLTEGNVHGEKQKTRFIYVLYSDKTRFFDQSERVLYQIYIIMINNARLKWMDTNKIVKINKNIIHWKLKSNSKYPKST